MSMKHIGTKILAGVLVVLLAGAGVLIWRNLPELRRTRNRSFTAPDVPREPAIPVMW